MTDARITLDAAALEELRGRTFLPGPVTTNQLIQQSRAALDLRDRVSTLEAELAASREDAKLAWAEAAMGPTEAAITHELAKLQAHANALRDAGTDMARALEKFHEEFPSYLYGMCALSDWNNAALAQTPAASLAARDAEMLEPYKAALRVFVDAGALDDFADDFAAEVRALSAQEDAENCSLSHEQIGEALRAAHENQLRRVGDAEAGFASDSAQGVKP